MIKLKNLCFSYGEKEIIKNLSFDFLPQERYCIFGTSGIGKTTLLRLIAGLEKPTDGEICITEDKKISFVFQEDRLLPFYTVEENLSLFSKHDRYNSALSKLELDQARNKYPSELSGGMSRRVAVARALSRDFDILLLDEPFRGLDPDTHKKTAEFINSLSKGKTVIAVSHNQEDIALLNCRAVDFDKL